MADLNYTPVSHRSDLISVGAILLIFTCVYFIASLDQALTYSLVFSVFLAIIQTKLPAQRDRRFWITLTTLVIIHVLLLSTLEIFEVRPGRVSLALAPIDGFGMWALINWVQRSFPSERDNNPPRLDQ